MKDDASTTRVHADAPWWRWSITGLSGLGLALSCVLSWQALRHGAMIGCGGGGPCEQVLNSRWSSVAGVVPVSGLAASAYLAMLVCCGAIGPANSAPVRRLAWRVLVILAVAAAASALWFVGVQKWIVRAWCPYCMATHVTSLALAAVVLWRAPWRSDDDGASVLAGVDSSGRRSVVLGVALAAALVATQVTVVPRPEVSGGGSQNNATGVDPRAVPLLGSPNARYVVQLLFDYQCPHCQQLHLMLGGALRSYDGQLAFALCPAPLNRQCNPYVERDVDEFKDSCALARVALAVWVADRAAFSAFDDWMASFDSGDRWHPRSLEAAQAKAVELVGRAKFAAAAKDPWIDRYLETCVRLYGDTMQQGQGGVPKLVFGPRWISPQPSTPADLVGSLQTRLGLPKP